VEKIGWHDMGENIKRLVEFDCLSLSIEGSGLSGNGFYEC